MSNKSHDKIYSVLLACRSIGIMSVRIISRSRNRGGVRAIRTTDYLTDLTGVQHIKCKWLTKLEGGGGGVRFRRPEDDSSLLPWPTCKRTGRITQQVIKEG